MLNAFFTLFFCLEGHAVRGRHGRVRGFRRRGRRRLCAAGVSFFAGITRRVHAPLALVGYPLRGMLTSERLSRGMEVRLRVVSRGIRELLGLVGRLLSFHGTRGGNFGLGPGRCGVNAVIRSICGCFAALTGREKVGLRMRIPRRRLLTSISGRTLAGVLDGLFTGTLGCTQACICLRLSISRGGRIFAVSVDGSKGVIPVRVHRGVFGTFIRCQSKGSVISNANVKLTVTHCLTRLRRNVLIVSQRLSYGHFVLSVPVLRRALPSSSRRRRGGPKCSSRSHRISSGSGERITSVLIMRSGGSVLTFIFERLSSLCRMLVTRGKIRTLSILRRGSISLVVDSVVVPLVSKIRLYGRLGRGLSCDRVPMVLLATGAGLRSEVRKLRRKTSTCVRGPFSVRCLHTGMTGLLDGQRELHHRFVRFPFVGTSTVTRAGTSRVFVDGLGRCMLHRLSGASLRVSSVTSTVGVKHSGFCQGLGKVLGVDPGRCLHLFHLGRTTSVLGRKACKIIRISCVMKFDAPSCFSDYFGGRFKMLPGSFVSR